MSIQSDYEKALDEIETLNPSANILSKAEALIRNPNSDIDDLQTILKSDAALTADIIRLSNCSFYGFTEPSQDLMMAISRVGFHEILKLIGMCISKSMFNKGLGHYQMSDQDYWAESVSKAILMEVLARLLSKDSQEAYTVGLLSSIGKVVINQVLDKVDSDAVYDGSVSIPEWEKSVLGFDNSFAGGMILKRWDFPPEISTAVLYQFKADKADEENSLMLNALVFADALIAQSGYDFMNDNIELTAEMEEFLRGNYVEDEELIAGLADAREKFRMAANELGVASAV